MRYFSPESERKEYVAVIRKQFEYDPNVIISKVEHVIHMYSYVLLLFVFLLNGDIMAR